MDPAKPGFESPIPIHIEHLTRDDAEFVDVIHTAAGTLGFVESLGHVDFFPNSGRAPQPGCDKLLLDCKYMWSDGRILHNTIYW